MYTPDVCVDVTTIKSFSQIVYVVPIVVSMLYTRMSYFLSAMLSIYDAHSYFITIKN